MFRVATVLILLSTEHCFPLKCREKLRMLFSRDPFLIYDSGLNFSSESNSPWKVEEEQKPWFALESHWNWFHLDMWWLAVWVRAVSQWALKCKLSELMIAFWQILKNHEVSQEPLRTTDFGSSVEISSISPWTSFLCVLRFSDKFLIFVSPLTAKFSQNFCKL
jgi:hypothetical protein